MKGDVVLVIFPYTHKTRYQKSPDFSKPRPALIFDISTTEKGFHVYEVCQITHVNRTEQQPGIWLEKGKKFFVQTGLEQSSFFNLNVITKTTEDFIYRKLGFFGNMLEVDKIRKENGK